MKTLKDTIRKRVAEKHLGREMIGVTAISAVRQYFDECKMDGIARKRWDIVYDDHPIQWYVKFDKIFIKTINQAIKIEIFKKKKEILTKVNEAIAKLGYAVQMVEIFTK